MASQRQHVLASAKPVAEALELSVAGLDEEMQTITVDSLYGRSFGVALLMLKGDSGIAGTASALRGREEETYRQLGEEPTHLGRQQPVRSLLENERLLGVRKPRCLHRLPLLPAQGLHAEDSNQR